MLLPAATKTSGTGRPLLRSGALGTWTPVRRRHAQIVFARALDLDADVACAANRTLLVQAHLDPPHAELGDDHLRDAVRERLDELELRLADELLQSLRDFLVVDRVVD